MKRSILIVDDDAWIRDSLTDALSRSGNEVRAAEHAEAALAAFAQSPADVVLTDVRMPGLDGLELLRLLRERMPDVAVVLRGMEVMDLSLAPDGQTLAIGFSCRVALMPVSGGELRWIDRGEPGSVRHRSGLPWTPDGRTILFVQSGGLWAVPVSGGEPRKLFSMPSLRHVRLHPDGRRLAFTGGPTRRELWVMENAPGFGSHR